MKSSSVTGWITVLMGVGAVAAVTLWQGKLTERWGGKDVAAELRRDADLLEGLFPKEFGPWQMVADTEADPAQLKAAGAVGHISREYKNIDTGVRIGVFVVCATPRDASGHTPDRCYPSAGFEIAEQEHREVIPLGDGTKAEAFSGCFRKPGESLRIMWTYGATGKWMAPQIARIELANFPAVYKVYAIINETSMQRGDGTRVGVQFLADLIPEFDRLIFSQASTAPTPDGAPRPLGSSAGADS